MGAKVLLVNDHPEEMHDIIRILHELNMNVDVVRSSTQALEQLTHDNYDLVVSDMLRNGIPDEGQRFLQQSRVLGIDRPTIFSVGRFEPDRGTPPYAFGITNQADDLLNYVFDILERIRG